MKNNKPKEEKSKKNKKKDRGRRKPRNCSLVTMTSQQPEARDRVGIKHEISDSRFGNASQKGN